MCRVRVYPVVPCPGRLTKVAHYKPSDLHKKLASAGGYARVLVLCAACNGAHYPRLHARGLARQRDTAERLGYATSVATVNAGLVDAAASGAYLLRPEHRHMPAGELDRHIAAALAAGGRV